MSISAPGGPGGTALLAGSLKIKAFGDGALVDHITITGQKSNVISFKGKEVDYFANGSLRNTFTGTSTVNGDGSQNVVTDGLYKGGSGRYKGATRPLPLHRENAARVDGHDRRIEGLDHLLIFYGADRGEWSREGAPGL